MTITEELKVQVERLENANMATKKKISSINKDLNSVISTIKKYGGNSVSDLPNILNNFKYSIIDNGNIKSNYAYNVKNDTATGNLYFFNFDNMVSFKPKFAILYRNDICSGFFISTKIHANKSIFIFINIGSSNNHYMTINNIPIRNEYFPIFIHGYDLYNITNKTIDFDRSGITVTDNVNIDYVYGKKINLKLILLT